MQGLRLDGATFVANVHVTGGSHADEQFRVAADFVEGRSQEEVILAGDVNLRPGEGRTYDMLRTRRFSEPLPGASTRSSCAGCLRRRRSRGPGPAPVDGALLSDHAPVELTVG